MTMEVRLLTRWGSRLQGDVVSVSDERAAYLESEGIAKVLGEVQEQEKADGPDSESEGIAKGKKK